MAQWNETIRNLWISVTETEIGTTPILRIRSGAAPTDCATADSGTVLAELTLPSDWLSAPSSGEAEQVGSWEDASADASGVAGHFRLYKVDGTTCVLQGTIGTTAGNDMVMVSTTIVEGASFTILDFLATSIGA